MERIARFLKDDEGIHKDVEINRRYLDGIRRVKDDKLKALLIELVREEEEHQKRKMNIIGQALRRIREIEAVNESE